MIEPLLDLPMHLRERLASAFESGLLPTAAAPGALQSVLGTIEHGSDVHASLSALGTLGVSPKAAAIWIRSLANVEARSPRADLVWSGPEVPGVHARDTRQVFDELIGAAQRTVWVSTYAYFDGPKAFASLARRMDAVTGLHVTLLLNIQRKRGDTTDSTYLVRQFADRFWGGEWPGVSHPQVFYDPRALDLNAPGGVLHAKAVVADDEVVFVTSANLTEAALERNIELGLLIRDHALAASVSAHFRGLIDRELLRPLPAD